MNIDPRDVKLLKLYREFLDNKETIDECIASLLKRGITPAYLNQAFGVSASACSRVKRKYGLPLS